MLLLIFIGIFCIGVPLGIYAAGTIKRALQKGRWERKFRVVNLQSPGKLTSK
tara:strand:- start:948 stop:1103 length:156 start_codon:yes stop_codon:yes gene_type:complete